MRPSRWWLTGFLSMFAGACDGGLLIGDGPDGGPTTTSTGGGGSSTSSGGAGASTSSSTMASTSVGSSSTTSGGGSSMTTGAGGSWMTTGAGGSSMTTGGGGMTGTGGAGGGIQVGACPGMNLDPEFGMLAFDNMPLGRVYDVWGAYGDLYVALGVETASWPNSSQLTALAHYDGSHWTLERLPDTTGIAQLTGIELLTPGSIISNLWALAGVPTSQQQAAVLRGSGAPGMHTWTSETVLDPAYGLVALGQQDAILSVYTQSNAFLGEVRRYNGMQWVNMDLPDVGVPYAFRKLRMRDATHIYGVGYSGGANMGSHVIGAFDGSKWSAHLVDDKCGNLDDVTSLPPDRIYTFGTDYTSMQRRVCRVSPDLATWTVIDEFPYSGGDNPTIVASDSGTVVAIVGSYMSGGPSHLRWIRNDTVYEACNMTPGLGAFTAWSTPGSHMIHFFSGAQAGATMSFARHIARLVDM